MEVRGIKQDLIPYVGNQELQWFYWGMEQWPDIHGLVDGPCDVVYLPTHYGEVVHPGVKISGVGMVIDGQGGPEMFSLSPKVPVGSHM